jgi:hypothetical protein
MGHTKFISAMQAEALPHNLEAALEPYFTKLDKALTLLKSLLQELRGDPTTNEAFQEYAIQILDCDDYSAETLSKMMFAYLETHNDIPGKKPLVEIAQGAFKAIDMIENVIKIMKALSQNNSFFLACV